VTRTFFYDINGSVVAEYEATGGTGYGALKRLNVSAGRLLAVDEVQPNGTKVTSYLMADRQGSTRVPMDAAGAVTSRHDYLPFGEELGAGTGAPGSPTGMRTAAQGYSVADNVRQRYADTRLDDATGLDHTLWRKLETRSGRWTTPDPYGKSLRVANPQSFNRYAYVHNDPMNFVDPSGLDDLDDWVPGPGDIIYTNTKDSGYGGIQGWLGGDTGMMLELPSPDAPTGGGSPEPQNLGARGQLTGDRLEAYKNGRAGALEALKNNSACKTFLLEKFGLSAGAVATAVGRQRAFDGLTSTITAADAGLVPHSDPRAGYQVKDLFTPTGSGIVGAIQAGYASPEDQGATQRDIYFGYYGFEASTIIHETLHSFTGLDDEALDQKAGGNLSVELQNHGCG
jgi:RHS repeat-associated protein